MKTYLFLFIFLVTIFSCKLSSSEDKIYENAIPVAEYTKQWRDKRKINQVFPYDIPLQTTDGFIVNSANLFKDLDKPLVISFWLSTCSPCLFELREIQNSYEQWKDEVDFRFVAISTDFEKNFGEVINITENAQFPFEVYWDFNKEYSRLMPKGLNGLPQLFIFDTKGEILYHKKRFRIGESAEIFEGIKKAAKEFNK